MIKPSPELAAIARRWVRAIDAKDGATLRNLVSDADELSFVGTSDNEVWTGHRVREGLEAHFREVPPFTWDERYLEAYEIGDAGWAFYSFSMQMQDRPEPVIGRATLVFAMQDGNWRIVHRHASFPRANTDVQGVEMHALDDLMNAARAEDAFKGETGIATLMFTDIVGSSALAEALGDRRWAGMIRAHMSMVSAVIEANGGRLVKSLGDGTMSTFTSSAAAMTAARDIHRRLDAAGEEPRLQVRIGLHTGDAVQDGGDFFGTVVNKAARIAGVARPGETRVSEAARIMVGGASGLRFSDPQRVALRGIEGDHLLYRLDAGSG